jgi:small subunit ribosomal protein S1
VHISELAWQLIENPRTIVKVGDRVEAKIIGIDNDKISLSIRALQADPWTEATSKYKVGDVVAGKVHKINHFGAFVYLDSDIHGLAHISEMLDTHPGKNINDLIKTGDDYSWKILSIEPREHRMGLTLVSDKEKPAKEVKEKKVKKPAHNATQGVAGGGKTEENGEVAEKAEKKVKKEKVEKAEDAEKPAEKKVKKEKKATKASEEK